MQARLGVLLVLCCSSAAAFHVGAPRPFPILQSPRGIALAQGPSEEGLVSEATALATPDAAADSGSGHHVTLPGWLEKLHHLEGLGLGSGLLVLSTVVSLALANLGPTSGPWLAMWESHLGPAIGAHQLSLRGWVNEGLMAVFFFLVGLEIKQELRCGSLASVRKAVLPCIAACGGMITPMLVYVAVQALLPLSSMAAVTVPMATDIAFAMAIYGFFRNRMPACASAFLLTLATVDDLGAIVVLATCFAHNIAAPFLVAAAAIVAGLVAAGRAGSSDLKVFASGGAALWWCLLRAGVNADVAGVVAALCISTRSTVRVASGAVESLSERLIGRLSPLSAFFIMPVFALANTAVKLGGASAAASVAPAAGIGAGLLLGKPLGIFGFTWLAQRLGIASYPEGMKPVHLAIVGVLGSIGFTMCLLLTEVALPAAWQTIPKLVILATSGLAALVAAAAMSKLPVIAPASSSSS